ncbi:AAA+ family ATPase [Defluviimonas aestuarii]|uniref:AAA+ family ATPase n=1 Tax=Albidovulum aestuarii TaxID=1130726 RepID=UPI00249CD9CF|nr:AAA+ family ATPase [Defluviimonas aestuarii]MDI3335229.1 AAA+ family ATPase [Defluviimonas aestuarii]
MPYIGGMNRIAITLTALMLSAAPLMAQEADDESVDEGFSLLEEGAKIIMRSMLDEVEPALKDLQFQLGEAWGEMGPMLHDLSAMIGDIKNYHAPEVLPNGDIIIRRKSPEELAMPEPGEEIDI